MWRVKCWVQRTLICCEEKWPEIRTCFSRCWLSGPLRQCWPGFGLLPSESSTWKSWDLGPGEAVLPPPSPPPWLAERGDPAAVCGVFRFLQHSRPFYKLIQNPILDKNSQGRNWFYSPNMIKALMWDLIQRGAWRIFPWGQESGRLTLFQRF